MCGRKMLEISMTLEIETKISSSQSATLNDLILSCFQDCGNMFKLFLSVTEYLETCNVVLMFESMNTFQRSFDRYIAKIKTSSTKVIPEDIRTEEFSIYI